MPNSTPSAGENTTKITQSVLTEKVNAFASTLLMIDLVWKAINILIVVGLTATAIVNAPKKSPNQMVRDYPELFIYILFVAVVLIVLWKIYDLFRIFSLGLGWVLLSINKNLENGKRHSSNLHGEIDPDM